MEIVVSLTKCIQRATYKMYFKIQQIGKLEIASTFWFHYENFALQSG
jgi:hypothetical protein